MKLKQIIGSAFVIARRDFTATVFSKAFLLFLIGPLFPALLGGGIGGIGAKMDEDAK
jgi:ABC-2 type transport system permease protein